MCRIGQLSGASSRRTRVPIVGRLLDGRGYVAGAAFARAAATGGPGWAWRSVAGSCAPTAATRRRPTSPRAARASREAAVAGEKVGAFALSIWRSPFVPCMIRGIGDRGELTEVWA